MDQAQQDAIGRLMADGFVLYRDIWDNRSPLLYVLAAMGRLIGLGGTFGIRLVDLAWKTATAGLLALYVQRIDGRRWSGLLCAVLYGWAYYGQGDHHCTCQPDGKIALFVVAGLLAIGVSQGTTKRLGRSFGGGMLWGLAFLMKYPAILIGPVFACALFKKMNRSVF